MSDAVQDRLASVAPGRFGGPGVAEFRRKYAADSMAQAYADFANTPVTRSVRAVLKDLALHPPAVVGDGASVAVQHGLTLGLGLAAQLLEDPTLVFPELFAAVPAAGGTGKDPGTSPDDYIDQL